MKKIIHMKSIGCCLLMLAVLLTFSACNDEDDVAEIFNGKTWKLARLTTENGKEQFYKYWECKVPQITNLIKSKHCGIEINIPQNYDDILSAYYGKNWSIPDPNFSQKKSYVEVKVKITEY